MPGVTGVLQYFGHAGALENENDMRNVVTADTTYYVRTVGSDFNNGLTPATAWLTIDHAIWYLNTQIDVQPPTAATPINLTIDIGAGTFAGLSSSMDFSNSEGGKLTIQGAGIGTTILTDGLQLFNMGGNLGLLVKGVTLQGTASTVIALFRCRGGVIQNSEFALFAGIDGIQTVSRSDISASDCTVSGTGARFVHMQTGDRGSIQLINITYSTPTFSSAVYDIGISNYLEDVGTNAGSATGKRFLVDGVLLLDYGAGSIQAGVGTVNGTFGSTGQVRGSDLTWHGNIAVPVP